MSAVVYGKHPAFGDFLAHGLPHDVLVKLDTWLEAVLPPLKEALADHWEAGWRAAPVLRFWLGPEVIGAPFTGVFVASRDKVGRRYPLMFGLTGVVSPPPTHPAHSEAPYSALIAHLHGFQMPKDGTRGVQTLLENFVLPDLVGTPYDAAQDGVIWGARNDGDTMRLLADARQTDADKAQMGRSHWWHPAEPHRDTGWLASNGLPDAAGISWLLTDRVRSVPTPAQDPESGSPPQSRATQNNPPVTDTAPQANGAGSHGTSERGGA